MQESSIWQEILKLAIPNDKVTLLVLLNSYDEVLQKHGISENSPQAISIYRLLLRWARDTDTTWQTKFYNEFGTELSPSELLSASKGDLSMAELDTNETKLSIVEKSQPGKLAEMGSSNADTPSFDERNARLFFGKQSKAKPTRAYSPPVKETDETDPKEILAHGFHQRRLKNRMFNYWKVLRDTKVFSQFKQDILDDIKSTVSAKSAAGLAQKLALAQGCYLSKLKTRVFNSWHRQQLKEYKTKISGMVCEQFQVRRVWNAWRQYQSGLKDRRMRSFTACFKHSQYILKKALISLARNVNSEIRLKVFTQKAYGNQGMRICKTAWEAWLAYMEFKQRNKMIEYKGYEASYRVAIRLGFRRFQRSLRMLRIVRERDDIASKIYRNRNLSKFWIAFKAGFSIRHASTVNTRKAQDYYEISLKSALFYTLAQAIELEKDRLENIEIAIQDNHISLILHFWKRSFIGYPKVNEKFVFCAYKWLLTFKAKNWRYENLSTERSGPLGLPLAISMSASPIAETRQKRANFLLQKAILEKVIKSWKFYNRRIRRGKLQIKTKTLAPVFRAWIEVMTFKKWADFVVKKHTHKKYSIIMENGFIAWTKYAKKVIQCRKQLDRIYDDDEDQAIIKSWKNWREAFLRRVRQRCNAVKQSKALIQEKKTKLFQYWLQKAKTALRKRHLEHIGLKYAMDRVMTNYWKTWRKRYLRTLTIVYETGKLLHVKESVVVAKVLTAWRELVPALRRETQANYAASLQYNWTLAKRSIIAWTRFRDSAMSKAHLYTILEDDNSTRIKRKGLRGLALYRKYRQRQAFTDRLAVPAIRRNRRRNIFRHWFNKALLYSSSRYLAEAFVKLAAKRFMRKLSQNVYLYNLTYTYLEVHRQRACKKLVLSALARYLKKRRALFLAARKFRPAHKQNLKVCTWQKWKRAYHKTQSSWRLFAFTIFYIKKELQQKMFHFWKLYINKRLRAKYCTIHRVLYLRKYIIAKWSAWTKKRMYLMEKGQNAATQEKIKTRREIFSWWLFTAYRRQDVRFKGMTIEGNRRRILFGKWRDALEWSLTKEVKIEKFQMKSIIDAQKRFIYKIYGQVQARKFAEGLNRLAQQHYQKIRRRQTFARWAYFKNVCMLNDSITSQIAYNIQGKTVKSIFSSWLEQSGARIKKVSALSKFCIALSKGLVGTWMDRWVDEVSRIVAVDSKVPSTDNFYVKKIMKKMFGYYKLYTAKRIERKEMYARVEDRFIQKRKATSVAAFNAARKQQQGKRAKIESADGLQRRRLLRKMLGAWARSNAQKHSMEDRIVLFKDRQLKRLGPLVFANLSKNVETQFTARENEQKSKNFASQYRKSTVIAYWKDLVDRNNMLFNNYHEFVNKKSFDTRAQTFNAIAKFTRDRQLMATNRLHLLQTISSVNNSNLLAMTFNSLSFFANQSKSAEENTKTQLMESKTRRLLRSWLNASRSLAEDAIKTARIEETINSRLRRELFKNWEMMFNRSFGIRKMQFKKARKQSVAILSKWLRWARINKHMRVTGSSANILLKKRCFDNLIFYASSSQKAVQKLTHVATIDLQNNFASCWDGMKKFLAQTSSTKSLLYRKRGNLARAIMSAWSHQVQLSLKLESFRLRIVETSIKKHFGAWQEALAIEQGKHTKLISILNGRYKRITKSALSSWKDLTRELALDELCYTQAIIPNTMNKMQNIFYSWRLVIERKLYLDECVAQWQKDRSAYILQCCFENWYGGVKPLLIANNKLESHKRRKRRSFKVKVFLSWVCYSRKQQKLKKTSVLAQQLTAQHVKEAHLHLWFKRYHLILMGREYAKSREQATVSTMFYFWLRLYESKTVNALLKRILTKQAMKTKAGMFQRWVQTSVFDEADIEKAEIFYAGLQERRIRRFFHNFRILAEDRIITGEVHDDIRSYFLLNKARRCFTAFKAACELQKIKREQYAHAEYKYYESLLLKVLLSLRDYACRHIESHIRIEENEIVALDFWREELMKKTFYRWLEWYNEGIYRRARSKLYEIFSSWKLYTRERSLLKRYLKESNLSDRYLHSSRESIPQITNRSQAYWTMRSISSNESKELDEAERLRIPSPSFPNTNS